MFYTYIYYPFRFAFLSFSRHRQMCYSYLIRLTILLLAVFSDSWQAFFQQWIQFEQAHTTEIFSITFGSWVFLLKIVRFSLTVFSVGFHIAYLGYGYIVFRAYICGQEESQYKYGFS